MDPTAVARESQEGDAPDVVFSARLSAPMAAPLLPTRVTETE